MRVPYEAIAAVRIISARGLLVGISRSLTDLGEMPSWCQEETFWPALL